MPGALQKARTGANARTQKKRRKDHEAAKRISPGDRYPQGRTPYDIKSFRNFVSTNFSSYITSQVFDAPDKAEKVYFSLEATEDGHAYNMVMASSSKNKTYKWISSLSERFSLVEMIATGIVYLKDNRTDTYQPFISGNGKYCRYDVEKGQIIEL